MDLLLITEPRGPTVYRHVPRREEIRALLDCSFYPLLDSFDGSMSKLHSCECFFTACDVNCHIDECAIQTNNHATVYLCPHRPMPLPNYFFRIISERKQKDKITHGTWH